MANDEKSSKTLPEILFELEEPVVFKNILNSAENSKHWNLVDWSLEDFADKCEALKLPFRVGKNAKTFYPQWEVETPTEYKTMKEFLNETLENSDSSKWFYFDYKRMNEWFKDKTDILNSFNWQQFEFDFDGSDSTIWIGSKGAHTNCHQDTYGCNLVAQTHGRKLWLLLSPECSNHMQSTRIPYEESTIYSKYNFFAPSERELEAIKSMPGIIKIVILEPKDVLFIPKGWWHYVESLETSLSVNVWIPLKEDCYARLKETLVHLIVNTVGDGIPKALDEPDSNLLECIEFLEKSIKECQNLEKNSDFIKKQKRFSNNADLIQFLKTKFSTPVQLLSNLTNENMDIFINKNDIVQNDSIVTEHNTNKKDELTSLNVLETVVDAFCSPEITLKVSQILTQTFIKR